MELATVDREDEGSLVRYEKTLNLMRDMREQGVGLLAVANEGDSEVGALADGFVPVRPAAESTLVISEVIPLQMFAYSMAVGRGIDVDRPRNLVKAVITE